METALLRFVPPKEFAACTAGTLGDARDDSISDPKKIIMKLHIIWGRASANKLKRVLAGSEECASHSVDFAGDILEQCDVCKAFDQAPHIAIAGTSAVSTFQEKVRVDLLFPDALIALRGMDMFRKNSLLSPVLPKNPKEVWDVFCRGWLGTFGPTRCLQMDEGGEWKDEIRTDLRAERRIKLQFHGVGAHPW